MTETNIPMRFFEAMAIGCLITNDSGNLAPYATPHEHYIPYRGTVELLANIDQYLAQPKDIEWIAKKSRQHALAHHTYEHRAQTIIDVCTTAPSK